jgi:hypothetical protein
MNNIIEFIWNTAEQLLSMAQVLFDFLMQEITILGYDVSLWGLLGGVGLIAIFIIKLAF